MIPLRTLGPILFLVLALGLSAQTVQDRVAGITSALRGGNAERAVQLADEALVSFPNNPQLWALKGIALSAENQAKQALDAYHRALAISPNYLPALEGAAQIQYNAGDKEAVTLLRRITQLRPDDPTSHAMLGALAYKQGDCAESVRAFQRSEKLIATEPGALQEYGTCLLRLKQPDKAVVIFQQLLATHPDDERARLALATVQSEAGQPREAVATLQPLLTSGEPDLGTLQVAASVYEATGDTPQAVKLLREALVKDPRNVWLYVNFANLALAHQSFQTGIEMMNSGLKLQPDAAPLYLARGVLYVQVGNFDMAQADFDKAEQLDPHQPAAAIAQGLAAEEKHQDDPNKALEVVRSKLLKNPNDPFLLYLEAALIQEKAPEVGSPEFEQGVRLAKKAIHLQPSLASVHDVLANFYLQAGKTDAAISECRAALQHSPKDQTALYRLIVALRRSGQKTEIPELLKRLASARQEATEQEAENNRYKLVVSPPASPE